MQECWDPIMTVVIPLTILNIFTTTAIVIGSKYIERSLWNKPLEQITSNDVNQSDSNCDGSVVKEIIISKFDINANANKELSDLTMIIEEYFEKQYQIRQLEQQEEEIDRLEQQQIEFKQQEKELRQHIEGLQHEDQQDLRTQFQRIQLKLKQQIRQSQYRLQQLKQQKEKQQLQVRLEKLEFNKESTEENVLRTPGRCSTSESSSNLDEQTSMENTECRIPMESSQDILLPSRCAIEHNECINDDDLIDALRVSSVLSVVNADNSPQPRKSQADVVFNDDDLIAAVRVSSVLSVVNADNSPQPRKSQANEIEGEIEQVSLESMAGTLISVTKKIAGTLNGANHIPNDKKQELANLLKGVPGFINKIVDMDDEELGAILKHKIPHNQNVATSEDHKKESEYLMQTLDAQRK